MKALKLILGVITVFVTLPISLYLQYQILQRVQASELMWFLFWIYVPLLFLLSLVAKLADDK